MWNFSQLSASSYLGAIRCSRGSSEAYVYTRASVRRASGFVLTGKREVIRSWNAKRVYSRLDGDNWQNQGLRRARISW